MTSNGKLILDAMKAAKKTNKVRIPQPKIPANKPKDMLPKQFADTMPQFEGGGLWDLNKRQWVDSVNNANINKDFVKRFYNQSLGSIQIPGEPGRSTHFMSYDPGSKRVYPTVVNINGRLTYLPDEDQAWNYADDTGEYIEFSTPEQAKWYASSKDNKSGYKMGTGVLGNKVKKGLPKKAKGGPTDLKNPSIVDYLNFKGLPSNKAYRKDLAKTYRVEDYDYSVNKNLELLSKLRAEDVDDASIARNQNNASMDAFRQKLMLESGVDPMLEGVSRSQMINPRIDLSTKIPSRYNIPTKQSVVSKQPVVTLPEFSPYPSFGRTPVATKTPVTSIPKFNPYPFTKQPVLAKQSVVSKEPVATIPPFNPYPFTKQLSNLPKKTTAKTAAANLEKNIEEKSWFENLGESIADAWDYVGGLGQGLDRKIDSMHDEDEKSIVKLNNSNITQNDTTPSINYGYRKLYSVPDIKHPKDSLVAFTNTFDNDSGGRYLMGHKVKEVTDAGAQKTFNNVEGVAHFLRDSDVLPGQKITPKEWTISKGYKFQTTSPGKSVSAQGFNDPERIRMLYKLNKDNSYQIKYLQNKEIDDKLAKELQKQGWSLDFTTGDQHRFSDIAWDKEGPSTGYAAKSKWIPLKGGSNTSIPYKNKDAFSRFSGGSGIYLFKDPKTGKKIGMDVAGSVNTLRQTGEDILKNYKIKPEDLIFTYHDMGSYSAKPKSHNGVLDYNQWLDYNTYNRGFSGAPIIIPKQKYGGYVVTRSHDRKGKTHKVTGPDGTVKYFGDSKLGQHPKDPERKAAFYARHKKNLDNNPFFRAFARKTWEEGGPVKNNSGNNIQDTLPLNMDTLQYDPNGMFAYYNKSGNKIDNNFGPEFMPTLDAERKYIKEWLNHPASLERASKLSGSKESGKKLIKNALTNINNTVITADANRFKELAGFGDSTSSYALTGKVLKTLQELDNLKAEKADNDFNTKGVVTRTLGSYHPSGHFITIPKPYVGREDLIKGTILHELSHASGLDDYHMKKTPLIPSDELKSWLNWSLSNNTKNNIKKELSERWSNQEDRDYLNRDGFYPRIMTLRYKNKLKPNEKITPERLQQLKKQDPRNDLFRYFDDQSVEWMLNNFVSNSNKDESNMAKLGGEMIRRADGSYSRRGLWDNIRANKGSGKRPTKEMLEQERKIRLDKKEDGGNLDYIYANSRKDLVPQKVNKTTPFKKVKEPYLVDISRQTAIDQLPYSPYVLAAKGLNEGKPFTGLSELLKLPFGPFGDAIGNIIQENPYGIDIKTLEEKVVPYARLVKGALLGNKTPITKIGEQILRSGETPNSKWYSKEYTLPTLFEAAKSYNIDDNTFTKFIEDNWDNTGGDYKKILEMANKKFSKKQYGGFLPKAEFGVINNIPVKGEKQPGSLSRADLEKMYALEKRLGTKTPLAEFAKKQQQKEQPYFKQDNRSAREKEIAQQLLAEAYMNEQRGNSPFARTLASYTPMGNNTEAARVAAEQFGEMTPIMSGKRLFQTISDPKNNPYGISGDAGWKNNLLGSLAYTGDMLDVAVPVAIPVRNATKGAAEAFSNSLNPYIKKGVNTFKNTADIPSLPKRLRNAIYSGSTALLEPFDKTHHSFFNMSPDEVADFIKMEKQNAVPGTLFGDTSMSINSTPIYWSQAARDAKKYPIIRTGDFQFTNDLGWKGKRVENAIPKKIKDLYSDDIKEYQALKADLDEQLKQNLITKDYYNDLINHNSPYRKMLTQLPYQHPDEYAKFLENYKPVLDNPIKLVNEKTGLNFPMSEINHFYRTPEAYSIKNPNTRVFKILTNSLGEAAKEFKKGLGFSLPKKETLSESELNDLINQLRGTHNVNDPLNSFNNIFGDNNIDPGDMVYHELKQGGSFNNKKQFGGTQLKNNDMYDFYNGGDFMPQMREGGYYDAEGHFRQAQGTGTWSGNAYYEDGGNFYAATPRFIQDTVFDIYKLFGGSTDDQEQMAYGGIHIKPSKRGTFTAAASKHNMGVQAFAKQVLANKENYSPAMVKKANFARNAAKWKHQYGGPVEGEEMDVTPEQLEQLRQQGYQFEILD
jgi:hypothetical protein